MRSNFEKPAALRQRKHCPGWIVKIGRDENEFHAVLQQHGFERVQIQADMADAPGVRFNANGQHTHTRSGKYRHCPRICRVLEGYRIARTQKGFAHQIDGLLAATRDQELLAANVQAVRAKEFNEDALQRLVPVRGTELQDVSAITAQYRIAAAPKFFNWKKLFGGPSCYKRNRIGRNIRHQASEIFVGSLVRKN